MARTRPDVTKTRWLSTFYSRAIPLPVIAFAGAVLTDWAYCSTLWLMWANVSAWLILVGLVGAVVALLALALLARLGGGHWLGVVLLGAATAVEIVNMLVHMRDGYTAVVSTGLMLSLGGAALTILAAWATRRQALEARS